MDRLVAKSPYSPITAREGKIMSDVRLIEERVLRTKAPSMFRPDVHESMSQPPTADHIQALSDSNSLYRLRYVSETKTDDLSHLTFMTHLAGAYLDLADGLAVWDSALGKLYSPSEFRTYLENHRDLEEFASQVRISWQNEAEGGTARTHGLQKIGVYEITTAPAPTDQEVLVTSILEMVAQKFWKQGFHEPQLRLETDYGPFVVQLENSSRFHHTARIFRESQP